MTFYDAMHEVLQRRRYDVLTGRRTDFGQAFIDWLERAITRLFDRIDFTAFYGTGIGDGLNTVAMVFAVVGIIIIVAAGIMLFRTFYDRSNKSESYDLSDIFEELAKKKYSVDELLNLSQSAHDRRISVRYRYIAALLALDEKQIIRIRPSATNRLILQEIKTAAPEFESSFFKTADVFHSSWFGYKTVTDETFKSFADAVNVLVVGKQ